MCVRSALWSSCLCVVSDVQWLVLKAGVPDWCSVIFSPLLCSPWFSTAHHPTSLCLFVSSDKTVKIWLSKVWRKRWEPAGRRFLCQPFFHNLSHWSVTCSLLPQKCDTEITVSKAIGVSFFVLLCHKATRQSRGEICSQKKKSLPFRLFFTANLKVPFKCGATWKR